MKLRNRQTNELTTIELAVGDQVKSYGNWSIIVEGPSTGLRGWDFADWSLEAADGPREAAILGRPDFGLL